MADGYLVSPELLAALYELLRQNGIRIGNTTGRPAVVSEDYLPPEVYLARAPEDGIPGLTENVTGTSATALGDDEPGSAECEVYRLVGTEMRPVANLTRRVHNASTAAVDAHAWVLVQRDKYGIWWATPTQTSAVCTALQALPGYSGSVVQVLGHDASGVCQWYDVEECP